MRKLFLFFIILILPLNEEIDQQRPVVASFRYWNPQQTGITVLNMATGEEIDIFSWGSEISNAQMADPENPEEAWNLLPGEIGIGHAVTGVGYIESWDPDEAGPLPQSDFAIVHDNWDTTPRNVAIPWQNWYATISVRVTLPVTRVESLWNLY